MAKTYRGRRCRSRTAGYRGCLLFAADGSGNFMALDSRDAKPLWHTRIGNASNAPETYLVDGRQHVLIAVGDTLYAFTLY